jgi:hypothetical protein
MRRPARRPRETVTVSVPARPSQAACDTATSTEPGQEMDLDRPPVPAIRSRCGEGASACNSPTTPSVRSGSTA